jgi:hypothetical protein
LRLLRLAGIDHAEFRALAERGLFQAALAAPGSRPDSRSRRRLGSVGAWFFAGF